MANRNLSAAKIAKQDEYYTQMNDIQAEINAYLDFDENTFRGKTVLLPCDDPEWSNFTLFFAQNFERLGLQKLISTSYAPESKTAKYGSLFAYAASQSGETPKNERGKIFVLYHDTNMNGRIDFEDLEWEYLKGDGDFRSEEVCRLRDEADVIVTNPPFSMFREFWAWVVGSVLATKNTKIPKQFLIIGNMNAITYKEVFPLLKENMAWLGATGFYTDMVFRVPKGTVVALADKAKAAKMGYVGDYTRLGNSCWFTNLDHGRRHRPLQTDAIPCDYEGVMGVPISFLDKYCPDQFEILGMCENEDLYGLKTRVYNHEECKRAYMAKFGKKGTYDLNASGVLTINGIQEKAYQRILIRRRRKSCQSYELGQEMKGVHHESDTSA